eukprot:9268981-Alexandrium_andersonii.AAC.1
MRLSAPIAPDSWPTPLRPRWLGCKQELSSAMPWAPHSKEPFVPQHSPEQCGLASPSEPPGGE